MKMSERTVEFAGCPASATRLEPMGGAGLSDMRSDSSEHADDVPCLQVVLVQKYKSKNINQFHVLGGVAGDVSKRIDGHRGRRRSFCGV